MNWFINGISKALNIFKNGGKKQPPLPRIIPPRDTLNLGDSLVNFIGRNRANQLESEPLFQESELEKRPLTKNILAMSDFRFLRKQAAFNISTLGNHYALPVPFRGNSVLVFWKILNMQATGNFVEKVIMISNTTWKYSNEWYPLMAELTWLGGGRAKLSRYIRNKAGQPIEIIDSHIYTGLTNLPGQIFKANELGKTDVEAACLTGAIGHFNYHTNELTQEWKKVSTKIINNENFSDLSNKEFESNVIEDGADVISGSGYNNKLQQGQEVFTSGSNSTTFNQLNINYLEDKILKYVGIMRESTSTGANKHSLEITLQNQFASEVLYSIRDQRESDYQRLFDSIAEITGEKPIKIKLELSVIEKAKVALLEEMVAAQKSKGTNSANNTAAREKENG